MASRAVHGAYDTPREPGCYAAAVVAAMSALLLLLSASIPIGSQAPEYLRVATFNGRPVAAELRGRVTVLESVDEHARRLGVEVLR